LIELLLYILGLTTRGQRLVCVPKYLVTNMRGHK
jgi:hypothetical protein